MITLEVPEWAIPLIVGIGLGYFLTSVISLELIGVIREFIETVLTAAIAWIKRRRFMLEYYGEIAAAKDQQNKERKRGAL